MKVSLEFSDEIGELGHYFNIMTKELGMANRQIKNYALRAVISRRNERKIRNIFQKYVPQDVIEKYYEEPESMLEGESRILGVLFSDIRNFTSFSEKMPPHEVVESLNKYFDFMVEIIMKHNGIVDKYIGDAIMAFFGAPVHHDNDAVEAVSAGLDMIDALARFNQWQFERNRQPFQMGIGINYGFMTVGNIGTEKKMDYTVIGDMVNLASRMEGLTKHYKQKILVAKSVYKKLDGKMPCRLIDRVRVKGKSEVHSVYTVRRELSRWEADAWEIYSQGMKLYFERKFNEAYESFEIAMKLMPGDFISELYRNRCDIFRRQEPPEDWQGVTIMDIK
jgi:class 3 adenylate cyclase